MSKVPLKHVDTDDHQAALILIALAQRMTGKTGNRLANSEPVLSDEEFLALGYAAGRLLAVPTKESA
jgi:hypothetical protein